MLPDTSSVLLWGHLFFLGMYSFTEGFFFFCTWLTALSPPWLSSLFLVLLNNSSISLCLSSCVITANDFILYPTSTDHSHGHWLDGIFSSFYCNSYYSFQVSHLTAQSIFLTHHSNIVVTNSTSATRFIKPTNFSLSIVLLMSSISSIPISISWIISILMYFQTHPTLDFFLPPSYSSGKA